MSHSSDYESDDFAPPDLIHYNPLGKQDVSLLQSLTKELKETGVLDRGTPIEAIRPDGSFQELFSEAAAGAVYENEYYRPEVDALVADREREQKEDWANPDLVGVDAFGESIKPQEKMFTSRARRGPNPFINDDEEDELDKIMEQEFKK